MSVINNSYPGSHIASLIFIDRILNRKIIKKSEYISIEKILEDYRPSNLFLSDEVGDDGNFISNPNPKKKVRQTIDFWREHGLWDSSEQGIKAFSALSNDTNISTRIVRTVFSEKYNLQTGLKIEPLIRGICLFLALDELTFSRQNSFKSTEIPLISAKYMPERSTDDTRLSINPSENATFLEYGLLLGYMEKVSRDKYIVDPTRLIKIYLSDIFSEKNEGSISVNTFIDRLNSNIPVFDRGEYRVEVEAMMKTKKSDWQPNPPHTLSKSLSHALYRLNLEGLIYLDRLSDSLEAVTLLLPNGELRTVSHIRMVGDI
ncbi:protein DpdG [Colwellia sp. MB02u-14]|uniref:protein DpdG n=1 Tax=Colwellia sp. MB02u-14 TaxID=2759815 RepID=UPI0015F6C0FF|nr:protein DpdG [Colwellia sp. MB02u-14]MBA6304937.1 hypothetical protein [Colwellia sp. MB02u-14]